MATAESAAGSSSADVPPLPILRSEALASSGGRVEIGAKPLIMRAEADLDSPVVTVLRPGQQVKVRQILETADGKLRAFVEQVEEEAAARAIADSWWSPFDPSEAFGKGEPEPLMLMPPSSNRYLMPPSQRSTSVRPIRRLRICSRRATRLLTATSNPSPRCRRLAPARRTATARRASWRSHPYRCQVSVRRSGCRVPS